MLTIVASSAIISWASAMKARAIHRRSAGRLLVGSANVGAELVAPPPRRDLSGQKTESDGEHDDCQRCHCRGLQGHQEDNPEDDSQPNPERHQKDGAAKHLAELGRERTLGAADRWPDARHPSPGTECSDNTQKQQAAE